MNNLFFSVCSSLLTIQDVKHSGPFPCSVRTEALRHLCTMNPDYALSIRSEAVQKCCLPELTIRLTLDFQVSHSGRRDLVEFLSGLLLGSDVHVRKWFAHFIKSGQKVSCLSCLRRFPSVRVVKYFKSCCVQSVG